MKFGPLVCVRYIGDFVIPGLVIGISLYRGSLLRDSLYRGFRYTAVRYIGFRSVHFTRTVAEEHRSF